MKQAERLTAFQAEMEMKIEQFAKECCLVGPNIEPITDGVCNIAKYVESCPQIAFILKEPWDETDPMTGIPTGGGYSIPKDCFTKNDTWKNPTYQPLIYALYGYRHHQNFSEMDSIANERSMAEELESIAYFNVNKMPALAQSNPARIQRAYEIWSPILCEQIEGYAPDIIICCGTYDLLAAGSMLRGAILLEEVIVDGLKYVSIYQSEERIYISTYHPLARMRGFRREHYVNILISALEKYEYIV